MSAHSSQGGEKSIVRREGGREMKRSEEGGCMGQGLRREKHLNVHEQEACSLLIRWRETESVFSTTQ